MSTFTLTAHAAVVVRERGIEVAWISRTLTSPTRTISDPVDPALRHALCDIEEREGRTLRVVYDPASTPWRVVTAFFDRRERRTP
ncbi:MAG: DUF4258 domain-containing protein [Actinomycetota bacterium]